MDLKQLSDIETVDIMKNKYFRRPWGKHKNGHWALIYNSGSYGQLAKVKDGRILDSRYVLLKCENGSIDVDKWAEEHGFILSKPDAEVKK